MGTVVEKSRTCIFSRKVEHIDIAVSNSLVEMLVDCDHKMVRENRIRIDEDVIFLALASLETHHHLFRRTVLTTEKAFARSDVRLAELCSGGNHPGRIELELHLKASDIHCPDFHVLESPEIAACKRPARELVRDELMYSVLFHSPWLRLLFMAILA